jgi:citrate synthase
MAADCRASFLHSLIAGFSTGAGMYHQGGLQATMVELQELAKIAPDKIESHLRRRLAKGGRIMGFGHRFHKQRDPRAQTLLQLAEELQFDGLHVKTVRRVEEVVSKLKKVPMNIEAAGSAILLDLGIDPAIAHLIIIIGRGPMFAAAYMERLAENRAPFQKIRVYDELAE